MLDDPLEHYFDVIAGLDGAEDNFRRVNFEGGHFYGGGAGDFQFSITHRRHLNGHGDLIGHSGNDQFSLGIHLVWGVFCFGRFFDRQFGCAIDDAAVGGFSHRFVHAIVHAGFIRAPIRLNAVQ